MTTDIDRLLEIERPLTDEPAFLRDSDFIRLEEEKSSLKSQIESKLNTCLKCGENPMQIHGWCYECIHENESKLAQAEEFEHYKLHNACGTGQIEIIRLQKELSQLRSTVQALREFSKSIHGSDVWYGYTLGTKLESILASSEIIQ